MGTNLDRGKALVASGEESGLALLGLSPVALSPADAAAIDKRRVEVLDSAGGLVRWMGVAPIPEGPIIVGGGAAGDWGIFDTASDPHWRNGDLKIPGPQRRQLRKIVGVHPEKIAAVDRLIKPAIARNPFAIERGHKKIPRRLRTAIAK